MQVNQTSCFELVMNQRVSVSLGSLIDKRFVEVLSFGFTIERFTRDLAENVFLAKIQFAYEQSLFDEHVTGTPTIYLNEIRYTGATDVQSLLEAIKQSDPEGQIQLPERAGQIRQFLRKLRQGSSGRV